MILAENLMALGTTYSSSTVAGTNRDNVKGPQTFDYWQGVSAPSSLGVTLASLTEADCWAIDAHNIGSLGASVNFTYSIDGTNFIGVTTITPANDDPILLIMPPVSALKFQMSVTTAPGGMPSIGIFYVGKRVVFPGGITPPYVPFNLARKIDLMNSRSLGGQLLSNRIERKGKGAAVSFNPIDGAWSDANLPIFAPVYDSGTPFFWAGCPAQMPDDVAYAWRGEGAPELRPQYGQGKLWVDLKLELDAYGA